LSPRNATLADILLSRIIQEAHRDRHKFIRPPKINAYRHQTLTATGPACRTKLYVRRFQAAYGQRMRFLQDRSVKLQFLAFMRRMLDRWGSLCFLGLL
jgi:hypothetical protein